MLRLVGAVLLTGGAMLLGLGPAGELSRRLEALALWQVVLELWEGELSFRLPDLPHLLADLVRTSPGPAGEALAAVKAELEHLGERSIEEIWTAALLEVPGPLDREDLEPLLALGPAMNRCGWEDQRRVLRGTRRKLEERAALLRREREQKGKAYAVLGFSLGAFLTILLL